MYFYPSTCAAVTNPMVDLKIVQNDVTWLGHLRI